MKKNKKKHVRNSLNQKKHRKQNKTKTVTFFSFQEKVLRELLLDFTSGSKSPHRSFTLAFRKSEHTCQGVDSETPGPREGWVSSLSPSWARPPGEDRADKSCHVGIASFEGTSNISEKSRVILCSHKDNEFMAYSPLFTGPPPGKLIFTKRRVLNLCQTLG